MEHAACQRLHAQNPCYFFLPGARPACVTLMSWPATITVPVREAAVVFSATAIARLPLPVPPGAPTVIHVARELAPQLHDPGEATIVTVNESAVAPASCVVGLTAKLHAGSPASCGAACVTDTERPPIVTVADLDDGVSFGATVIRTTSDPVPLPGSAAAHAWFDEALQVHEGSLATSVTSS
jgi:hypothetical protein